MLIQEAFMMCAHPQWLAVRELVDSGRIGELQTMLRAFSYFNDDPGNIRNVLEDAVRNLACMTAIARAATCGAWEEPV